MFYQDAVIQGLKKPCTCNSSFQVYEYIYKTRKLKSNFIKDLESIVSGKSEYWTHKNWLADCSHCGKLWLVETNKKRLISNIKKMEIPFEEIDIKDSIRKGG